MDIPASIFRAYDVRGVVDRDLTSARVEALDLAFGSMARQKGLQRLAVAQDKRLSGPRLQKALLDGLLASGCTVLNLGMVPTPVLYFAIEYLQADGGIMVTGSHNPPDYNGLKMVLDGQSLHGDAIQALYQRCVADDFVTGAGAHDAVVDVLAAYRARIVNDVHLARPLRIALDCGNGVAGVVAPNLFQVLGCTVHELFSDIDGGFSHHHPDPSDPENLQDLMALVDAEDLDIGLAFDGDADRLGVVVPGREIIWPDRLLMFFAEDILARYPGVPILFDIKSTRQLIEVVKAAGGQPIMWKTGHSVLKSKMAELGAPLAGELSGHLFFGDRWYGFDDGLYAGARLLELLSQRSAAPGAVLHTLPKAYSTPELRIPLTEGEHFVLMEDIRRAARGRFTGTPVIELDGLRVEFTDGWGLVRASNTQPVLTLRFEGDSEAALARIESEFRDLLRAARADLSLPLYKDDRRIMRRNCACHQND